MARLPRATFLELRAKALALTPAERKALTWTAAEAFLGVSPRETIAFRNMRGGTSTTPWQAVARLRGIPE